ncbi:nitroreductase/quinone reductase family protein [Actinoplanes sp. NPDC049265]|uniref:nitroreductase/quinone reductase family protein n=1 Tax=Actinoplanes sp. NPDC049265 TaxID=3363902 RepID=UPI003724B537
MSDIKAPPSEVAHNREVVADLRDGKDVIGGMFPRPAVMLMTTTGARTGRAHTWPVIKFVHGDAFLAVASSAGRDRHPAWYHNVLAHPRVSVELWTGDVFESFEADVTPCRPEEREALWATVVEQNPLFENYRTMTTRVLPILHVTPVTGERR